MVTYLNKILNVLFILYISFSFQTINDQIIAKISHLISNLSLYYANIQGKSLTGMREPYIKIDISPLWYLI